MNPLDLTGRRILVTGGSSGIGRETAILLSQLGAQLIVSGRNPAELECTAAQLDGARHSVSPFDIADLDGIAAWIKSLAASHGPFDGAVHSAGIHKAAPVRVLKASALDEIMRINVESAAMIARALCRKDCRAASLSIVFLSSVAGMVGESGVSAYSASKAALIGLTRSLAVELAPERIRVNAVAPGFVESEMGDRLKKSLTPEQFSAIERKHPLGLGKPRNVANGIAFLLADTSRWITGTTLVIDGGFTAH